MSPQSVEIGIVLDPASRHHGILEAIERLVSLAVLRKEAGSVIAGARVVGIQCQGSPDPFVSAFMLLQHVKAAGPEVVGALVVRIVLEDCFGARDTDFGCVPR